MSDPSMGPIAYARLMAEMSADGSALPPVSPPTVMEQLAAVDLWQYDDRLHPLTCGNDSGHKPLIPVLVYGKAVLICPECDYLQHHIPSPVVDFWRESRASVPPVSDPEAARVEREKATIRQYIETFHPGDGDWDSIEIRMPRRFWRAALRDGPPTGGEQDESAALPVR